MKKGDQTARCRALLPEVREYLDSLGPTELPVSFDNWAAMADSVYVVFAHAIRRYDPVLAVEYMSRRHAILSRRRQAVADAKTPAERAAVAAELGLTEHQVRNIARRAGARVRTFIPWDQIIKQLAELLSAGPARVIDLAAQLGVNKHVIYAGDGRKRMVNHFDFFTQKYGRTHCAYMKLKEKPDARNNRKRSR